MKLIGITGGIGCGKTTALNEFKKLGVPCFIADEEAKKLYDDPVFAEKIKAIFPHAVCGYEEHLNSSTILDEKGNIDKKKVAKIIFRNKIYLEELNKLIHPVVRKRFLDWCVNLHKENEDLPYVIIESALLYQSSLQELLDEIIVVYLDKEERIRRCMLRDKTTRERIELRMDNQMSAEEMVEKADYLIFNYEGNPLRKQVEIIDRCIKKKEDYSTKENKVVHIYIPN